MSPLPRFLFGAAQYAPQDGGAHQLVVFGGQTLGGCALNDVWAWELGPARRWTQLSAPYFATRACDKRFGG